MSHPVQELQLLTSRKLHSWLTVYLATGEEAGVAGSCLIIGLKPRRRGGVQPGQSAGPG